MWISTKTVYICRGGLPVMRSAVATGIGAYDGRVARLPACARLSTAGTTPRHALGRGLNRGLPGAVRTHRPPFDTPLGQSQRQSKAGFTPVTVD